MSTRPPILPVLAHYGAGDLPETYRWKAVRCPFHDDRNASASYIANDEAQAFNCHSCGIRGDAISLIRQHEGLDYLGSLKVLKDLTGSDHTAGTPEPARRYKPVRIGHTPTPADTPRRRRKLRLRED